MSGSSIEAGIQFIRYKIDNISFSANKTLNVLNSSNHSDTNCNYKFSVSNPIRYKNNDEVIYVVGLVTKIIMTKKDNPDYVYAEGEFSISGLFKGVGNISKDLEENLIKHQAPAIIFPYLRANVSSVLLNAGFSQIQMPLINVNKLTHELTLEIEEYNK